MQFTRKYGPVDRVKMAAVAYAVVVGGLLLARQVWRIWARFATPNLWMRPITSRLPLLDSVFARDVFLCAWMVLASVMLGLLSARTVAAVGCRWRGRGRGW